MITHLTIRHFAIIDQAQLDLTTGLSVVTGETGAGKSIIIDAIQLALGGRADAKVVRVGQERCEISLTCDISSNSAAKSWLEEHALDSDDDCLLRRIISAEGRSKAFINGSPCTLSQLKSLAEKLITIHGQHQNQALLQRFYQLDLLDHYASHRALSQQVEACYAEWKNISEQINELKNQTETTAGTELLRYQVDELAKLELGADEYATLDKEQTLLAHAEKHMANAQQIIALLNDDDNQSAISSLYQAAKLVSDISRHTSLGSTSELMQQAIVNCEEALNEVQQFLDHSELNPERLHTVEQRLGIIHDYARKHRIEPNAVYTLYASLQTRLDQIENGDRYLEELEQQLKIKADQYFAAAKKLSTSRKKSGEVLGKLITEKMQLLSMAGGKCELVLAPYQDRTPRPRGMESVTFMVSANPGQPLQPMTKVASGGEISRIALAIHTICAEKMPTHSMIFDEVDVGIGGSTATMVGQLLQQLSQHTQILCITHLPQVAVFGQHHIRVSKSKTIDATFSNLDVLAPEARVTEIARMLGGSQITENTKANAKELINAAL